MKNANLVSLGGLLLAVFLAGCGRAEVAREEAPKTVADWFTIDVGGQKVRMQLAVRSHEMERGLMGRTDLGRDEGMLFVFESPRTLSFWMRNTPTPLDIGYFTRAGVLAEIYPLHPHDEAAVASRGDRLQFALEMNQGWYRERGVKPGAQLDMKALAAAMRERGFDPRRFGME